MKVRRAGMTRGNSSIRLKDYGRSGEKGGGVQGRNHQKRRNKDKDGETPEHSLWSTEVPDIPNFPFN